MRRSALAAGGAALAIALAGCGSSGGGGDGTVAGQAQPLFGNTQKLVQVASSSASKLKTTKVTMDLKGSSKSMHAQGRMRFAGENTAMAMTMQAAGQKMQFRFIDKTIYFKVPQQMRSMMSTDKPWLKIPLDGDGKMAQMLGSTFEKSMQQADPTKILQRVDKAGRITKKERTANGSHYWVEINLMKSMKVSNPKMLQQMPEQMKSQLKGTTMPAQIWLNKDSLPTKITMDMSKMAQAMSQTQSGQTAAMNGKLVMKYHDWGAPVEVKAPPKSKVGTFEMPDIGSMPN